MNRRIALLIVFCLLLPAASAGTAADPEIQDPDTDAAAGSGSCGTACPPTAGSPTPSAQAEIEQAWISQRNATGVEVDPLTTPDILRLHVQMKAAGDATTTISVEFATNITEESRHFKTGNHTFAFSVNGATPGANAPANTTAAWNGTVLEIDIPLNETGIVGGDLLHSFAVSSSDETSEGTGVPTVSQTWTTTDRAPDAGFGDNLTINRPPIAPLIRLEVLGGTLTQNITSVENGTELDPRLDARNVTGDLIDLAPSTEPINATAVLQVRLHNEGNDPDNGTITIRDVTNKLAGLGINATLSSGTFDLLPGANATFDLTIVFNGTPEGTHPIQLSAESARNAVAAATIRAKVPAELIIPIDEPDPAPTPSNPATPTGEGSERTPKPAGLSFLSPVAEGMNLDAAFGDYAELVFLSIVLLLVILIVFLIIMLVRRGGVSIVIEPRTVDVAPGGIAEFQVHVKNSRGEPVDAVASFEGDPGWETSIEFGGTQMREQGIEAGLRLGAKDDASGTRTGTLRVRAPKGAEHKESDRVTLNVAQLDQYGAPKRNRSTQVRVRTVATADNLPIRLVSVDHQPEAPEPGDVVETTARIENDSDEETYHLRVVLNVDGEDLQEQPLAIPPRNARAVVFSWQVPAGSSKIRVRIFQD